MTPLVRSPLQPCTPLGDLLMLAPCLPRLDGDACSLRWFHLLRFLARYYRVHLGCSTDPLRDGAQFSRVRALCHDTCFMPPKGIRLRVHAGAGRDPELAAWVAQLCRQRPIAAVLACGARMGGYLPALPPDMVRIVDFVELESDQRRRHGALRRWPGKLLWRRQARRLLAAERAAGAACDHALFAGAADVARFRLFAPESAHKTGQLASGVDPDYHSPHILQRSPFTPGRRALVLAGPLDSRSAADAAHWLAREVFAPLHGADPTLSLHLVGPGAVARVASLARQPGVVVRGAVTDPRPWLAHAALVLAPAGGGHAASMAVLAAMAMQKTVLGLPRALDGLACPILPEACAAADAPGFRARIAALLADPDAMDTGRAARARVLREHDWNLRLAPLPALLGAGSRRLASAG